ncbi:MAG: type II toxin-antitoxin system HicA family toxin [Dehalococcoidia bacterium]
MPRVPRISGTQAVRAFEKAGWVASRQSGSHAVLLKEGSILSLSIPLHRELGPGLLRD